MATPSRTSSASRSEARKRLRLAEAYLSDAERVQAEHDEEEFHSVSASASVLAGIAAADAICAARLGMIHRGPGHSGSADLLEKAVPDGKRLAVHLQRLLDIKGVAQYGANFLAAGRAKSALGWAGKLVSRAREECER